jgi:amidase
MVGKTVTEELTWGLTGEYVRGRIPINPKAPDCVPGGSSSGSAVAVASGLCDFALGTDTLGSVRVPASFCGLFGIRTTHHRVPLTGVLPQAPSYDTVGWFSRDAETLARVGRVILGTSDDWKFKRAVIIMDAFSVCDDGVQEVLAPVINVIRRMGVSISETQICPQGLGGWVDQQFILQSREAWNTFRKWIEASNPSLLYSTGSAMADASQFSNDQLELACEQKRRACSLLMGFLADDMFLIIPTTPGAPPRKGSVPRDYIHRIITLTTPASAAGLPQVQIPVTDRGGAPVGISIIGSPNCDECLLAFATSLENALGLHSC